MASKVLRRRKPAGSSLEPNPRVEGAHVRFMDSWAREVSRIQRANWPAIRKLIVSEQRRLGARSDSARADQTQKSVPKVNALVRDMVAEYAARVSAESDQSEARTKEIEGALESTSSTAWADNIESLVDLVPGLGGDEKTEINEFLISEEPGIPRSVRREWIREQLGLISARPVAPVKVAGKLIETISGRSMKRLRKIVTQGILRGTRVESIMKDLAGLPGMTSRHAELIARDQVVKQNGRMTQIRHEGIGVTHYTWQTVGDQRVRKKHQFYRGKRYSYTKGPPGGLNPGLEIQCRCWASPDLLGAVRNLRAAKARGDARPPRRRLLPGRTRRAPSSRVDTSYRAMFAKSTAQGSCGHQSGTHHRTCG